MRTSMIDLEQNEDESVWFINKIYVVTVFEKRTFK